MVRMKSQLFWSFCGALAVFVQDFKFIGPTGTQSLSSDQ